LAALNILVYFLWWQKIGVIKKNLKIEKQNINVWLTLTYEIMLLGDAY